MFGVVHTHLIACVFKDCSTLARFEDCGRKFSSKEYQPPRLSHVIKLCSAGHVVSTEQHEFSIKMQRFVDSEYEEGESDLWGIRIAGAGGDDCIVNGVFLVVFC